MLIEKTMQKSEAAEKSDEEDDKHLELEVPLEPAQPCGMYFILFHSLRSAQTVPLQYLSIISMCST